MGPRVKPEDDARGLQSRPVVSTDPQGGRVANLPITDPLKRFHFGPVRRHAKTFPRITWIGSSEPTPIPDGWYPSPDDQLAAAPLQRRLHTLKHALEDLDKQARRLARWRARLKQYFALPHDQRKPRRLGVMRPGWPPGYRKRPVHEIDDILKDLHSLAIYARQLDTS